MKQALFILAVALYLVSLCACGDQKIQFKSKQGSATQQVVQEQMANVTGETTVPPTAIPEQQPASDETTPETSVPESEQMQPAEALSDYEPAQVSGEPDVDLTTLSSTMVYSEVYNMMYEPDRYVGKRIKMNGQFAVYEDPNTGAVYTACIIMDARGYLFPGRFGGHVEEPYIGDPISRLLPDGYAAHTLRHRFATTAYAATHDLFVVAELLGHESVETTEHYVAMPDGRLREATAAVRLDV